MLAPEDIKDPRRKSGYKHVSVSAHDKLPYRASFRLSPAKDDVLKLPRRATALEAATDACTHLNSRPPLTIADIRNPNRKSGFDHVTHDNSSGRNPGHPFRAVAYAGDINKSGLAWRGVRRATAEESAQDYCDYVNARRGATPALPSYPEVKIDMGNTKRHAPKPEKVKVIREKFVGPHDVYDVLFVNSRGHVVCRKVGITARGKARYADTCKTLGMHVTPFAPAVTFPSAEAARVAETAKVAEVAGDPEWRRIAKEAFEPLSDKFDRKGTNA
jgi:hypothetical protein